MTDISLPLPELKFSNHYVDYEEAVDFMENRVASIHAGDGKECLWFLEHPPLYTAGTSAKASDLLRPDQFPVYKSGRGGQFTYHGPGQRVVYLMLDLNQRGRDIRCFICQIEQWIIATLADFNIDARIRDGRVGVWVANSSPPYQEHKIAAIGIRLKRWISYHGMSINLEPDLSHFAGIIPCGITAHGVTSIAELGHIVSLAELDQALIRNFKDIF